MKVLLEAMEKRGQKQDLNRNSMSRENHYTSIEVGKKLKELGVSPKIGYECYIVLESSKEISKKPSFTLVIYDVLEQETALPCFSIAECLDILNEVKCHNKRHIYTNNSDVLTDFDYYLSNQKITLETINKTAESWK